MIQRQVISGPAIELTRLPANWLAALPDYCELLQANNGLVLLDGLFRVFGVGSDCFVRDGVKWNAASWRGSYKVPPSILFWGENVFGDQLGVSTESGELLLMHCEGGDLEIVTCRSISECIDRILCEPGEWADMDLVVAADRLGLSPSNSEHLSFVVPLICGGKDNATNLEVMDGDAHLDLLGQMLEHGRLVADNTKISGFTSD